MVGLTSTCYAGAFCLLLGSSSLRFPLVTYSATYKKAGDLVFGTKFYESTGPTAGCSEVDRYNTSN